MWKILRPHVVVFTEVLVSHRPDRIVLEGRPDIPSDIFGRLHLEYGLLAHRAELAVEMVHPVHEMGDPAGVVLRRNNLESGEAFEDLAKNEAGEGSLHLINRLHGAD